MSMQFDNIEESLLELTNDYLKKYNKKLKNYQKIDLRVYNKDIIDHILKSCKFKDIGNVYDYPDTLPCPRYMDGSDLTSDYKLFNRIAISKKFKSVVYYTINEYSIYSTFLVDVKHIKQFFKNAKYVMQYNSEYNPFRDVDFNCANKEYIEITEEPTDKTKRYSILKKKVVDEKLVFDRKSTLNDVIHDITSFFTQKTRDMYNKLALPYKRGIILHGNPGNGKSAMIREMIRILPDVTKILVNSNYEGITRLLQSLILSLNGRTAIIIIEDIDSVITVYNRSEFLNILDGINTISGVYLIGTTNYPERIDPAFMNRAGRFDRMYKIDNPSENMRKMFFESKNIDSLFSENRIFNNYNIKNSKKAIVELFVKHSNNLPMASLKELITSTSYILTSDPNTTIEGAVKRAYELISVDMGLHKDSYNNYMKQSRSSRFRKNRLEFDDDEFPIEFDNTIRNNDDKSKDKPKSSIRVIKLKSEELLTYFTPEYYYNSQKSTS